MPILVNLFELNLDSMAERIAKVKCPNCRKKVVAFRATGGRILVTSTAGLALAGVGGFIGAGIGLATGGWAAPATIPAATVGLVVGLGAGYIISDKTMDKHRCPKCQNTINLGI